MLCPFAPDMLPTDPLVRTLLALVQFPPVLAENGVDVADEADIRIAAAVTATRLSGGVSVQSTLPAQAELFPQSIRFALQVRRDLTILLPDPPSAPAPAVQILICNIMRTSVGTRTSKTVLIPLGHGIEVKSRDSSAIAAAMGGREILRRVHQTEGEFRRTASYLGGKGALVGAIVAAVSPILGDGNGAFVDLMCGSGVVAGAAAESWPTYASDALSFCRLLASTRGGGMTVVRAAQLLAEIRPEYERHRERLSVPLSRLLATEAQLLHGDSSGDLVEEYADFVATTPTFPDGRPSGDWDPVSMVNSAKDRTVSAGTHCLFTAYFANIYFGVQQCVDLDSLRFATASLRPGQERDWCLGVLVATASRVSTTYGGHFAQPIETSARRLSRSRKLRLMERRSRPVWREYEARFKAIARDSERIEFDVEGIEGPWRTALDALRFAPNDSVVVYVDPPYTREEHSRYYHVLETLVRYDYPSAQGSGRVPNKTKGERFATEFFTRKRERVEAILSSIVQQVLDGGHSCLLSYSTTGKARLSRVIEGVASRVTYKLSLFAVPHVHIGHGGASPRQVQEYLVRFDPTSSRPTDA